MAEEKSRKCTYFNSGYCKFTRKENGCRYLHPAESCQIQKCRDKACPLRHPKKCRHGEQCRYQTRCMYNHAKDNASKARSKMIGDNAKNMDEELKLLKAEVDKLKAENEFRVEALARIHLLELEDVKQKHNKLLKGYMKEVKELKKTKSKIANEISIKGVYKCYPRVYKAKQSRERI